MFEAFLNIWKVVDLRKKLLFTVAMLGIYRIGFWIPLPGVSQQAMEDFAEQARTSAGGTGTAGQVLEFVSIFTGGSFSQSTLFGLGIMPYISAAIIFQLLVTVVPALEKLKKEGPTGQQKIQEYTRYTTVGLCIIQAVFWLKFIESQQWVYPEWMGKPIFWIAGITALTAGSVFLMWLGEQIDKFGIGNGASLIITAGILASFPRAIGFIVTSFDPTIGAEGTGMIGPEKIIFLIAAFVFVTGGAVLITQGQRRIPVQQAKHTRGRRVYGGQRSYLPLRVNHGGVMPIIFASSLMMVPTMLFGWLETAMPGPFVRFLSAQFMYGAFIHVLLYIAMIYFFAYFWTTVQFQPKEMAQQLRDHGSFIPGLRPGPRTAEYLERVMERITYVGAGFLSIIAIVPTIISVSMGIPYMVAQFLGGVGLLITVSVSLDFVQRIEANLLMRNYRGFLSGSSGKTGPRLRGPNS